jgi:hypothetical protein
MENKQDWINWIDDQIKDMYNNEDYTNQSVNRVFKTEKDDREIAVHILETFKDLIEKS